MSFRYYGDPALRRRADEVAEMTDELRRLIVELRETRHLHEGAGVAAPQVGGRLRVFLARLDDFDAAGHFVEGPLLVFINPKLSNPSKETEVMDEGCLSIPGIRVPVERPVAITVDALDEDGKPFKLELRGLPARIIMHENDHLNGTLTVDRTPKKVRNMIEPVLRTIRDKYYKPQG